MTQIATIDMPSLQKRRTYNCKVELEKGKPINHKPLETDTKDISR